MVASGKLNAVKADIIGGEDITSNRAVFDRDDKNIIVASNRQIIYFDLNNCESSGKAYISSNKLRDTEIIIACERYEDSLYLFTNYGKIFIWSLETRCWFHESSLPVSQNESLVSCKLFNKRQYVYTILDNEENKITINHSVSKSEREHPKERELIGKCSGGSQITFDIACFIDESNATTSPEDNQKQSFITYTSKSKLFFKGITNDGLSDNNFYQRIKEKHFTCVRANPTRPMVAGGDTLGRIYLYTGDFVKGKLNRTNLHWHSMPVNDLCYSSTGGTLFSVGGESGCVVIWNLTSNSIGQKRIVARLGMPIRFINCANNLNQLVLSFEDNEIQFLNTDDRTKSLRTLTRTTIEMFDQNDCKALRRPFQKTQLDNSEDRSTLESSSPQRFMGLLWHSKSDTIVSNCRNGMIQFYSPRLRAKVLNLNILKNHVLSLEKESRVIPSELTRGAMTIDGNWLACYETRQTDDTFPVIKLHIWQRSLVTFHWSWVQTIDRLHASLDIADLKFSPDGRFLITMSEDGSFQILHRVVLDSRVDDMSKAKQMYVKGYAGNVPKNLPTLAAFSHDSSVMAISLKNDTTLIWMIEDPYKLVYECQLNQIELDDNDRLSDKSSKALNQQVLGLNFGNHLETVKVAPICEVRSNGIRVWNVLNPQQNSRYSIFDTTMRTRRSKFDEGLRLTAATFDLCSGQNNESPNYLAVSNKNNKVLVFKVDLAPASTNLSPMITVDASLPFVRQTPSIYTHMCFLEKPVSEIDDACCSNPEAVKLLSRLCLYNLHQEIVSFTDKLTFERQQTSNSCNEIKTLEMNELNEYLSKRLSSFDEGLTNLNDITSLMTQKQRIIRNKQEVQKMLKDLLLRIPAHNLPQMQTLGPMILDKLIDQS